MRNAPLVDIVVLNWNGKEDTLECLDSIHKVDYPHYKAIVVDNGSRDGSAAAIHGKYPDIPVIENKENLGFAEGNNVGIRYAVKDGADYILLLNNDAIADPGLLKAFIDEAGRHSDAGIFSGKIYHYSEPGRLWYAGVKWNEKGSYFQDLSQGAMDNEKDFQQAAETDYANGCAMFFKADIVKKIGFFDPIFFLCYEEIDWCYRARRAGYKCFFVPDAKIWHKVSVSLGGDKSLLRNYFNTRNILLWGERYLPRNKYFALLSKTFGDVFGFDIGKPENGWIGKRLYWAFSSSYRRLLLRKKDDVIKSGYLGLRDYLLRRFGKGPDELWNLKDAGEKWRG